MDPALPNEAADPRMTIDEYLALFDQGLIEPDDRVRRAAEQISKMLKS